MWILCKRWLSHQSPLSSLPHLALGMVEVMTWPDVPAHRCHSSSCQSVYFGQSKLAMRCKGSRDPWVVEPWHKGEAPYLFNNTIYLQWTLVIKLLEINIHEAAIILHKHVGFHWQLAGTLHLTWAWQINNLQTNVIAAKIRLNCHSMLNHSNPRITIGCFYYRLKRGYVYIATFTGGLGPTTMTTNTTHIPINKTHTPVLGHTLQLHFCGIADFQY